MVHLSQSQMCHCLLAMASPTYGGMNQGGLMDLIALYQLEPGSIA